MAKIDPQHEPHLVLKEISLAPGEEWCPRIRGWTAIHVTAGSGYWLRPGSNEELPPGSALVIRNHLAGKIRASQVGSLALAFFQVEPERLTGLLTLSDLQFFRAAGATKDGWFRLVPPESNWAAKFGELYATGNGHTLTFRLQLLQFFIEFLAPDMKPFLAPRENSIGARERLRKFLEQVPASELLSISPGELMRQACCTSRHLSRVFQEVVGMSFRDKKTQLRLARARELLATSEIKILEVALESGYQSVGLFNLMFKNRFGITPGQWRAKARTQNRFATRGRRFQI